MLDHMTFRVTDIQRAKAFYSAALAPLGYSVCFEGNYGMNILGFAYREIRQSFIDMEEMLKVTRQTPQVADAPNAVALPRPVDARGASVAFEGVGFRHDARANGLEDVSFYAAPGTTTALEAMEKVPQFFEMPLISSTYWPMVHGGKAEEVLSDEEGLQIMRNLGRNMAWMLRCIEAGKAAGIAAPVAENDKRTNFIR